MMQAFIDGNEVVTIERRRCGQLTMTAGYEGEEPFLVLYGTGEELRSLLSRMLESLGENY